MSVGVRRTTTLLIPLHSFTTFLHFYSFSWLKPGAPTPVPLLHAMFLMLHISFNERLMRPLTRLT